MDVTREWIERFNAKWKLNAESGCWEWTAALYTSGYGQIKVPRKRIQAQAHRLSYAIHKGPIPQGQYVLHRCDNRKCVNPEHLFLGTKKDNAQDMVAKGRHCFGEKQAGAKLTAKHVHVALELIRLGVKQIRIAQMLDISPMELSRIKRGERWAHLQPGKPKWRKQREFISVKQAEQILQRLSGGESQHQIAKSLGITQSQVSRIARGKVQKFQKAGLLR